MSLFSVRDHELDEQSPISWGGGSVPAQMHATIKKLRAQVHHFSVKQVHANMLMCSEFGLCILFFATAPGRLHPAVL